MPRLMPSLLKQREKPLYVATKTVYGSGGTGNPHAARVARGQTLPEDHYLVRAHPDAFEPVPVGIVRGPVPRPDEPVAIARTTFIATDGQWIHGGTRLYPWDEIVRAAPLYFSIELPRD
jgi:hypothetical protein